jgi:hypothetical protein
MTRFQVVIAMSLLACCFAANTSNAGILVANDSAVTLVVYLQGPKDAKYHGPYSVPPRGKLEIDAPSGKYNVVAKRPDGTFHYLGWQDYSDSKLTFSISLVKICMPIGRGEKTVIVEKPCLSVWHEYRCPDCGQIHRKSMSSQDR